MACGVWRVRASYIGISSHRSCLPCLILSHTTLVICNICLTFHYNYVSVFAGKEGKQGSVMTKSVKSALNITKISSVLQPVDEIR